MSFGFSLSDVISLSALAWNCYKSCRDSSEQFQRISGEVGNLKAVLDETIEAVQDNQPLSRTREERLMRVMEECQQVLIDLEKLLNSYESMNTQTQRTWDRFRFGMEDVAGVRSRLISHTTTLGALSQGILR
jgi:Fungal N-terminal domain of STAND proteins